MVVGFFVLCLVLFICFVVLLCCFDVLLGLGVVLLCGFLFLILCLYS